MYSTVSHASNNKDEVLAALEACSDGRTVADNCNSDRTVLGAFSVVVCGQYLRQCCHVDASVAVY